MKILFFLASAVTATELNGECFQDFPNRVLNGVGKILDPTITVESCHELCLNKGFAYAGVQHGNECFCGDTAPVFPAENCNMRCTGDPKKEQICGGYWAMNVYSTSKPPKPVTFNRIELNGECFQDFGNRVLNGLGKILDPTITVESCHDLCLNEGFAYAGVQHGNECFCGDTAPTTAAANCNMRCTGDPKQICGGYWAMNVYSTSRKTYSCEHSWQSPGETEATLECADGFIQVNSATYGTPTTNMCIGHGKVCNGSADHTDRVKAECDGETSCTYRGSNGDEGDPCYGIQKHTEISYSCIKPSEHVYSCEHRHQGQQNAKLRCSGGKTIKIQSAIYGSTDEDICPSKNSHKNKDETCEETIDHTAHAAAVCDGEESCEYHGTNRHGDPCFGVEKFTHIHYVCQDVRIYSGECVADAVYRVLDDDVQWDNPKQSLENCLDYCKGRVPNKTEARYRYHL